MSVTILGLPQLYAKFAELAVAGQVAAQASKAALSADVAARAESLVPVDTGETQASIEVTEEGVEASGATLYLEFGTYRMAAQPFLRPAADTASPATAEAAAAAIFRAV